MVRTHSPAPAQTYAYISVLSAVESNGIIYFSFSEYFVVSDDKS